ncbi:testis-expressed protein 10-like [Lineus longissimus]|uniref:testis-expressed protein 10-like n=1 Tax=Lineus longissimus TaxID=88925 RepID=UPI002B4F2BE2
MVKSRKKKNEKKDFQKVKFKVGKKLPQADNVTNVSFQSKGIRIKEQLKADSAQPSNKRKQNINDLLSQTRHYNTTVRHDSLTGLKELIIMHPEVGRENLSTIIERVSALFVDKDGVIRQTVLKLLNVLFPKTTASSLAPFFSVINAHLCCAMTHIDEQIQADSLNVVDILLKFYPSVLIDHCSQLLPNFINLISKQTQKQTKSGSAGPRRLSINPNTKVHAQKWRVKVLDRLYSFLQALAKSVEDRDKENTTLDTSVKISCGGRNVFHQPKIPLSYPIPFCNGFRLRPQQGMKKLPQQDVLNQPEQLKNFVLTLMPLLLDCWVECSPAQLIANVPGNAPAADTLAAMLSIIKVIQLLWQCVEGLSSDHEEISLSWLTNTYMNEFVHHFMAYFPYAGQEVLTRNKRSKKVEIKQVSVMGLNLRVSEIMVYFLQEKLVEVRHNHWVHNLMDFIITAAEGSRLPAEEGQLLLEIFRRLVKVEFPEGSKLLSDLLEAVWSMYRRSHHASVERRNFLTLILEDILPRKHYLSYPMMQEWLASLPEFLLTCSLDNDNTVNLILEAMGKVAAQKHADFSSSFEKYLQGILDPENGVLLRLRLPQQRKLVEILPSVSALDKGDLVNLLGCCRSEKFDITNVGYLLQILHDRYHHHENQFCEASAYLSFMLSLCTGCQKDCNNSSPERGPLCSLNVVDAHGWERQLKLIKMVCELFNLWPNTGQVWTITFSYILKFKKKSSELSLLSAVAILELFKTLYKADSAIKRQVCHALSEVVVKAAVTTLVLAEEGAVSQMEVDVTNVSASQMEEDVTHSVNGRLSSAQISDTWVLMEDVMMVLPGLVDVCVDQMSSLLHGCSVPADSCHMLSALVNLLKPDRVKTSITNKVHFKETVQIILDFHSGAGYSRYSKQVAALKYELSLVMLKG